MKNETNYYDNLDELDKETLEKLEILSKGVEAGIVTPEEFLRIKASYEICARESCAIKSYEEKYGLVDDLDIDDGIILNGSFETTLDTEDDE